MYLHRRVKQRLEQQPLTPRGSISISMALMLCSSDDASGSTMIAMQRSTSLSVQPVHAISGDLHDAFMVLMQIHLIRKLSLRDCLHMQEAYALPIWFHPKTVAMNHRNNLASDTPLNFQLRNSIRMISQPGIFEKQSGSSDWMMMTKSNQCRCSEDFYQLQHGCLQHWREWTASNLPADPFLIDKVEEDFVLW